MEEEYIVEYIVGEKRTKQRNGRYTTKFLVKWHGYDVPTWEPAANMTNCREKIEEYRARGSTNAANGAEVGEKAGDDNDVGEGTVGDEETKEDVANVYDIDNDAPMAPDDNDSGKDEETKNDAEDTVVDDETNDDVPGLYEINDDAPMTPDDDDEDEDEETKSDDEDEDEETKSDADDDDAPTTPDDEDEDEDEHEHEETESDADNTAMDADSDEPSYAR